MVPRMSLAGSSPDGALSLALWRGCVSCESGVSGTRFRGVPRSYLAVLTQGGKMTLTGSELTALRSSRKLSDRAFGLELEFRRGSDRSHDLYYYTRKVAEALRPYGQQDLANAMEDYGHSDGQTWDIKPDGSCEFELATPRLTRADWPKVVAVVTALVKAGAVVDRSCGYHVHHEARDYQLKHIRALIRMWGAFDNAIHEALPFSRRNNEYARRWDRSDVAFFADAESVRNRVVAEGRYASLNLTIWWTSGRMEFRAHSATLSPEKILDWLLLTQRFVETARYGRPMRILAGWENWNIADQFEQLSAVIGGALKARWLNYLRRRNPRLTAALVNLIAQRSRGIVSATTEGEACAESMA